VASSYLTAGAGEPLPQPAPGSYLTLRVPGAREPACRSGVCHTCVKAVLAGQTAYTTPPLEPPGADEVLICSARPVGDLVLDL
jgi:ferredoxin